MSQAKPKMQEILRLIRNPKTGEQAIQIAGRHFHKIEDVSHEKAKAIILAAVGHLVEFAGGYEALVDAGAAPPLTTAPALPEESLDTFTAEFADVMAKNPPEAQSSPDQNQAEPPPLPLALAKQTAEEEEAKPFSFWGSLRTRSTPKPVDPLPVLNIGRQINTIVQRKLQEEPQLQGRGISISNDEFGGIEINVDNNTFEDVAQISDPLIRMLIKVAIKEWEDGRSIP